MRLIVSMIATAAVVFAAGAASALTFQATPSTDLATLTAGDSFSVDVLILNDTNEATAGLGAAAFNFDTAVLTFTGGLAAQSALNASLFFGILPSGGLQNVQGTAGAPVGPTDLKNPQILGAESDLGGAIRFFNAVTTSPVVGHAEFDAGITPALIGNTLDGDVHARLNFVYNGGLTNLVIGVDGVTGAWIDGLGANRTADVVNASLQVGVVPEPGTALLMGLGLLGLSAAGRRRE